MSERKHKSGYDLLKEKFAKAEAKNAELQKEKEILVQTAQDNYCRVEKERDEWKARNNELCNVYDSLSKEYNNQQKRIRWLLDHASWFTLRKYRKQFEKGGN